MFVPTYNKEIIRLLLELKAETSKQLSAVQAEEAEEFLQNTDRCSSIMKAIDGFQLQNITAIGESSLEWKEIIKEILKIREQISILLPPLYEKLKQKADSEKHLNFVKRRYNQEDRPVPSIFLDKKI
jgi:hypothetical protein